ncbi:MAG: hypothetical protein KBT36_17265 [Kurthia sp.]|nr:hypothetical protein [Candidatus Kurthia equi]
MKTIEERAYDCAYDISNDWMKDNPTWDDVELAYKRGAIEQRDIDVEEGDIAQQENILKALEKQKKTDTYKAEMNFCIFCSSYDNCGARYSCETFEKFCKAIGG